MFQADSPTSRRKWQRFFFGSVLYGERGFLLRSSMEAIKGVMIDDLR